MTGEADATVESERLEKALHDLGAPLSTLRGQLELGQMMGDAVSLRNAVDAALVECVRVFEQLQQLRACVAAKGKSG